MDELEENSIVEKSTCMSSSNGDCKKESQLSKDVPGEQYKDIEDEILNSQTSDISDEKEIEEEGEIEEELIVGEDGEIEEEGEIEEGETVDEDENINKNDIEDGEIDDMSMPEMQNKQNCRFFQQGKCLYGRDCRYLHLSDKGLYHMFDSPLKYRRPLPPIPPFMNEVFINLPMPLPLPPPPLPPPPVENERTAESVWDKALYEAKERIKQSKMKKDADYSDNKLHMTVRNDWSRSKRSRSISPYDRSISPVPISEKGGNNSFNRRINENKFERKEYVNKTRNPPLERKTYDNRAGRDLEWCDPWRRSKTPPKHKRRSFSASSKSSISSRSSWESSGKDYRSPSPKRRNTRKHSFRSSESPYRRSSRGSMSSHSRSSSSSEYSSGDKRRHTSHKKKVPSYDNVVLPFYKHRSVSPSKKTGFQKAAPVEKKKPQTPSPRRRTRSRSSSKSSAGRRASVASSRSRTYSDMSVSNISDSSLSDKSHSTDKSKRKTVSERVKFKIYNPNSRVISSKSSEILKGNPVSQTKPLRTVSAVPEPRVQTKLKTKKINALEMELLKYQNEYRKKSVSPEKSVESPTKTVPELPINVKNIKKEKMDDISRSSSKAANSEPHKKQSKRDLLIQQLKAVEEAIARKKKAS